MDKVALSDEKKFSTDGPDELQYYWHDLRKEKETYFSRQIGGGSVVIWGRFSANGTTELATLDGKQDSDKYIFTLCGDRYGTLLLGLASSFNFISCSTGLEIRC